MGTNESMTLTELDQKFMTTGMTISGIMIINYDIKQTFYHCLDRKWFWIWKFYDNKWDIPLTGMTLSGHDCTCNG